MRNLHSRTHTKCPHAYREKTPFNANYLANDFGCLLRFNIINIANGRKMSVFWGGGLASWFDTHIRAALTQFRKVSLCKSIKTVRSPEAMVRFHIQPAVHPFDAQNKHHHRIRSVNTISLQ